MSTVKHGEVVPVRVWLTDGSGAPFSDLHTLPATHPGPFSRAMAYKGTIDPAVPVGTAVVDSARSDDVLVPEAEWCLALPGGVGAYGDDPQRVNLDTPVVLQGLIEGKWLNRLTGTAEWRPGSLGNNLLAGGPGIATTLGAIEAGELGDVIVSYGYGPKGQERTRTQRTALTDLKGQNILELVRAVVAHCRDTQQQVDWIDFGALGADAAIVNEPARLQAAMRASGRAPADLFAPAGFQKVVGQFVKVVLAEGVTVPPLNPITLAVHGPNGDVVGQGQLMWGVPSA